MAKPMKMPITGKMVTHFSLGSTFLVHGFSTSPFLILREWKNLCDLSSKRPPMAEEEPKLLAGREAEGLAKGFGPPVRCEACDSRPSPKGFRPVASEVGVAVRCGVVTAVETAEAAALPP